MAQQVEGMKPRKNIGYSCLQWLLGHQGESSCRYPLKAQHGNPQLPRIALKKIKPAPLSLKQQEVCVFFTDVCPEVGQPRTPPISIVSSHSPI